MAFFRFSSNNTTHIISAIALRVSDPIFVMKNEKKTYQVQEIWKWLQVVSIKLQSDPNFHESSSGKKYRCGSTSDKESEIHVISDKNPVFDILICNY